MRNDGITSAEIRLAQTLLSTRAVDEDLSEMVRTHLLGIYRRALAGETTTTRELISLLVATYTVGNSALALCGGNSAQALEQAADYHAAHADERNARPAEGA